MDSESKDTLYVGMVRSSTGVRWSETSLVKSYPVTCVNCEHYCSEIHSADGGIWHQHDYCTLWNTTIPKFVGESKMGIESIDDDAEIYDDIETGFARCHGFEPRADGKFTNVFKTNKRK